MVNIEPFIESSKKFSYNLTHQSRSGTIVIRQSIWLISLFFQLDCSNPGSTYYPLDEGRTWKYRISSNSMLGSGAGQQAILTNMPQRELNGRKTIPQKIDSGWQNQFIFMISDDTGIFEYAVQRPGSAQPQIHNRPMYYLKFPIETGAVWGGTTETTLLTDRLSLSIQTIIEASDDVVTVPAGTFEECVRTKSVGETSRNLGAFLGTARITVEEYTWFCPDIGVVKNMRREKSNHRMMGSGEIIMELEAFEK